MKKIVIIFIFAIVFFASIIGIKLIFFPEPVVLDVTSGLVLEFTGVTGDGIANIKENKIDYEGSNRYVQDIIDNLTYEIEPQRNLSNFDEITVTVKIDEESLNKANVTLKNTVKKYQVRGLEETLEQKQKLYDIVDGIEIPKAWGLTDEEKESYVEYQKQIEANQGEIIQDFGVQNSWQKGISEKETSKSSKKFYIEDTGNNSDIAYKRANEYGMDSSQEYKIIPIIENEDTVGYECVFKE